MGVVYRARDLTSGAPVALKVLRAHGASAHERFEREIRVLAGIRHPNVVGHVAHGWLEPSGPWLAMEWVDGPDLATFLPGRGLNATEALALARGLLSGLGEAHRCGVVHRDVKPSNLLLPDGVPGRVKIADFGVARLEGGPGITSTGVAIGTPGYMAPEQARGAREVDARVDLFAVGSVLFECLTGTPTFTGDHPVAIFAKVLLEEAPRLREVRADLPPAWEEVVAWLLRKSPDERPRSAGEALDALALLSDGDFAAPSRENVPRFESITTSERRLVSVVLVDDRPYRVDPGLPTVVAENDESLSTIAERYGGRVEFLADGSALLVLLGRDAATDLAARAARMALAARATAPGRRIAVATGRAERVHRWPVGEAVDLAAELVRDEGVRLDELTAGLLDTRFEIRADEHGLVLVAERRVERAGRPVLGRTIPCVGRERELGSLTGIWAECVEEETPRAVLVHGVAGIGKSRLLRELRDRLQSAEVSPHVLVADGDPLRAGSAHGVVGRLVRQASRVEDDDAPGPAWTKLRAHVRRHHDGADADRLAAFLSHVARVPGSESDALSSARSNPQLMADQLRRAVSAWLGAEARSRPLVLIVEDLHWSDPSSLELLEDALGRLDQSPILLLATSRRAPADETSFSTLDVEKMLLRELRPKASERLLRAALGDDADEASLTRLAEEGGGNAFFLEELARESLRRDSASMPATVLAMAQARLETLDPAARRVLRAAAIFGRRFVPAQAAALLGPGGHQLLERTLPSLVEAEILDRGRSGSRAYSFRHDLLSAAAYAMLPEEDRRGGHLAAARWLEESAEADPFVVAQHLEKGEDLPRAAAGYMRAARRATSDHDLAAAALAIERGLAVGSEGKVRGELLHLDAEVHLWRGDPAGAAERSKEALSLVDGAGRAAVASVFLQSAGRLGRLDEVRAVLAEVREIPKGAGAARALAHGAMELFRSGARDEGAEVLNEAEAAADGIEDPLSRGELIYARCIQLTHATAWTELESRIGVAITHYESAEHRRMVCSLRGERAFARLQLGDLVGAQEDVEVCIQGARRMGIEHVTFWALGLRSSIRLELGNVAGAVSDAREAARAFERLGDVRLEGASKVYLALASNADGRAEEALGAALAAVELLAAFPPLAGWAWAAVARSHLDAGRGAEALEASERGVALYDELGYLEEGDVLLLATHAEARDANALDSSGAWERARALVRDRKTALDEEQRRRLERSLFSYRRVASQ